MSKNSVRLQRASQLPGDGRSGDVPLDPAGVMGNSSFFSIYR